GRGLRGPPALGDGPSHRGPPPDEELGDEPPRAGARPPSADQSEADRVRGDEGPPRGDDAAVPVRRRPGAPGGAAPEGRRGPRDVPDGPEARDRGPPREPVSDRCAGDPPGERGYHGPRGGRVAGA